MKIPRILIVAGSDSGGGAGIQADIKTVTMLGGHAMTAVTAITAQNTLGVQAVMPVPAEMVVAQMRACLDDIGADAVKIGMLGSAETALAVAEYLTALRRDTAIPVVFDPVMIASSGDPLADAETIGCFERLIAVTTVTTPNTDELAALSNKSDRSDLGIFDAGADLAERFTTAILATGTRIEGGGVIKTAADGTAAHFATKDLLFDRLFSSDPVTRFSEWEWSDTIIESRHTHGTGCTLASAIAVGLAEGMTLPDSITRARAFVRCAIHAAPGFGAGHGPMGQQFVTEFRCPA